MATTEQEATLSFFFFGKKRGLLQEGRGVRSWEGEEVDKWAFRQTDRDRRTDRSRARRAEKQGGEQIEQM